MKVKKYVVIFCEKDDKGKFITRNFPNRLPYGYHHIVGVYSKDYYRLVATIYAGKNEAEVLIIAKVLAGDLPIEIESNFYLRS